MHRAFLGAARTVPSVLIMFVSWYLSSKSTIQSMPGFFGADKIVHIICFAGLAGSWTFWFSSGSWREHFLRNVLLCVLVVAVYGIVDEVHQSFTPGRECSIFDWFADVFGASLGSVAGGFCMSRFVPKGKTS